MFLTEKKRKILTIAGILIANMECYMQYFETRNQSSESETDSSLKILHIVSLRFIFGLSFIKKGMFHAHVYVLLSIFFYPFRYNHHIQGVEVQCCESGISGQWIFEGKKSDDQKINKTY